MVAPNLNVLVSRLGEYRGECEAIAAWRAGEGMTRSEAVALALEGLDGPTRPADR